MVLDSADELEGDENDDEQCLEEDWSGFHVAGLQAKMMTFAIDCQVPKKTFEDAKKAAFDALNSCPPDVIRRFMNQSWRFMEAYCIGLKGKAAAWAVCKQSAIILMPSYLRDL